MQMLSQAKSQESNIFQLIWIVVYFAASEVIPNYSCLDSCFMKTYEEPKDISNGMLESNKLLIHCEQDMISSHKDEGSKRSNEKKTIDKDKNIFKFDLLTLKDTLSKGRGKLGTVYSGLYDMKAIAVREISFERLTRYDLENFNKDLVDILYEVQIDLLIILTYAK
jgi:hypothetical protein